MYLFSYIYIDKYKNKLCTFYILECNNENESFYKIGITSSSIKRRYQSKRFMPYNYNIVLELKGSSQYVWDLETKLKQNLKNSYRPLIPFGGSHTECYTDIDEIKLYI